MPKAHVTSTARVKAWREDLRRRADLYERVNAERLNRLTTEASFCLGDLREIGAVLIALSANPLCFRFPREIDALGCLWRGPDPAGVDVNTAKAALEAHRAKTAQQVPAPAETVETAHAAAV